MGRVTQLDLFANPVDPLALWCPTCRAKPHEPCTTITGREMPNLTHPSRTPRRKRART